MATISNKSIFYHIPKTAGAWVNLMFRYTIKRNSGQTTWRAKNFIAESSYDEGYWGNYISYLLGLRKGHITPWNVRPEDKKGKFSFTFVRQPVSWYRSQWIDRWHAKRHTKNMGIFLMDWMYDEDFETYVRNMLKAFPGGYVSTLYKLFTGTDGKMLDFVGKKENVREDLITALKMAGETNINEGRIRNQHPVNTARDRKGFVGEVKINKNLQDLINKKERWVIDTFYK